jgi:hypothetical protein
MTEEIGWPNEYIGAKLYWDKDDPTWGWLHFIDPRGNRAVVPVTTGPQTERSGSPVWHVEVTDDHAVVSPSVHYVGVWHSPNPVVFKLVEEL